MGVISRPSDEKGHGPVAEWDKADKHSIDAAEVVFARLKDSGHTMYDISEDKPLSEHKKIDAFDPDASEIYAQPRLVGG